jgi:Raf kinase inhibitor-like YbhB/YbcL family protein
MLNMSNLRILIIIAAIAVLAIAGLFMGVLPPSTTNVGIQTNLILTSSAFKNGEPIPRKYTCDGASISPSLAWANAPKETKSYALIVDDPDAPAGTFTHWVIFNIPTTENSLPENIPTSQTLPSGASQGKNGAGKIGYTGPCPPSGTHRYMFQFYALDTQLNLPPGSTKQDVMNAMQSHILAQTQLTGLYSRS